MNGKGTSSTGYVTASLEVAVILGLRFLRRDRYGSVAGDRGDGSYYPENR